MKQNINTVKVFIRKTSLPKIIKPLKKYIFFKEVIFPCVDGAYLAWLKHQILVVLVPTLFLYKISDFSCVISLYFSIFSTFHHGDGRKERCDSNCCSSSPLSRTKASRPSLPSSYVAVLHEQQQLRLLAYLGKQGRIVATSLPTYLVQQLTIQRIHRCT